MIIPPTYYNKSKLAKMTNFFALAENVFALLAEKI